MSEFTAEIYWAYEGTDQYNQRYTGIMQDSVWDNVSANMCFHDLMIFPAKSILTSEALEKGVPFVYPIAYRHYVGSASRKSIIAEFAWISPDVLQAARDNKCVIVFDDKYEGFPEFEFFEAPFLQLFNDFADHHAIPRNNVVVVTGNLKHARAFNGSSVRVATENWFIRASQLMHYKPRNLRMRMYKHSTNKPKRFLAYNRHWNDTRQHFVFELFYRDLIKHGLVSLSGPDNPMAKQHIGNEGCIQHWTGGDAEKIKLYRERLNEFLNALPLSLDADLSVNLADTFNLDHYAQCDISIVNETWSHNTTLFLSEKIFKTIVAKHPFIVLSSVDFLKELHKLGFKTFHPYIDESYDSEPDLVKRKDMIIREIERFCALPDQERIEIMGKMLEISAYNFQVFARLEGFGRNLYNQITEALK